MKLKFLTICAFSILTLAACGGGGSSSGSSTDSTSAGSTTGTRVAGTVVASDTGQPLAGVQVQLAGKTSTTATDGSFSQDGLEATDGVVVRFVREGYADAFATTDVISGASSKVTARMAPVAASATFDNAAGATLSDSASPARVTLAPSSLVNAATGAAPQGAVTATIAPINPATNPANMPGSYTSSSGDPIESFGALSVQLRDSAGNRLNLAAGSKATIRIPLASRSTAPPQTIPLYYFNETTGRWVEEGSATLAGVAPDQYYEGSVGHFSTWNAGQKLDRVFVNGCLADAAGKSAASVAVVSEGVDYSGNALSVSDDQGKFRIAIRKNARAKIEVADSGNSNAVLAGPSSSDITLPTCLVFDPATYSAKPGFVVQPRSMSAPADTPALFFSWVAGKGPFTYQWLRNGQPIAGATQATYLLRATTAGDDQAQFSVKVSNATGSVTSDIATLTVTAALDLKGLEDLISGIFLFNTLDEMGYASLDKFVDSTATSAVWRNSASACSAGSASGTLNGQAIPVGSSAYLNDANVVGTFDKCTVSPSETLSGTTNLTYSASVGAFSGTSQIKDFRISGDLDTSFARDLTGNGTLTLTSSTTASAGNSLGSYVMTPGAGSTLRNNLTGQTAQFVSGSSAYNDVSTAEGTKILEQTVAQRDVTFVVDGATYTSSGSYTYLTPLTGATSWSGQIGLSRNGFQIGRIFGTSTGLYYEVNGVVHQWSAVQSQASARGQMRAVK